MNDLETSPHTAQTELTETPRVLLTSMSGSYGGMEIRMQQDAEMLLAQGWRPVISTPEFPQRPMWEAQLDKASS